MVVPYSLAHAAWFMPYSEGVARIRWQQSPQQRVHNIARAARGPQFAVTLGMWLSPFTALPDRCYCVHCVRVRAA